MEGEFKEEVLCIAALGRPFRLGMLYDCRSEKLIPGITLWDKCTLQEKHVQIHKTGDFHIIVSDTIEEKSTVLDVNAGLKLSFLGGLVEVSGSGKYLDNRKSSSHCERVTMQYKCTTRTEEMTMDQLGKEKIQFPEVFGHGQATHVVIGITYGAHAFLVFDREMSSNSLDYEVDGNLHVLIKAIPGRKIDGNGEVDLSENEKKSVKKFNCTFFGDFLPKENPSTYEDAVRFYKDIPNYIGDQGENTVPITVRLYPLASLDNKACKFVREVSSHIVKEIEMAAEHLHEVEIRCGDVLRSQAVQKFRGIQGMLKKFKDSVCSYKLDFQKEVSYLLPQIRGGGKEEHALEELLQKKEQSPFSHTALSTWIETKECQVKILSEYVSSLSQIKFASEPGDLESKYMSPRCLKVFCFSISMPVSDDFLIDMSKCLRKETNSMDSGVTNDNKVFPLTEIKNENTMMVKAKHFRKLFEDNKDENIEFIVVEEPSESSNFQAKIKYYDNGALIDDDFAIPCSQPGKPESRKISSISAVVEWTKPVSVAPNYTVTKYIVLEQQDETPWHEVACVTHGNLFVTLSIDPNTTYKYKVYCECDPFGKSNNSEASDDIQYEFLNVDLLKSKICKESESLQTAGLHIYKIKLKKVAYNDQHSIQKRIFGPEKYDVQEKVIMLVGATGSGKTTLINGIVNYVFGVKWSDNFRFKMITESMSHNQAMSQTSKITSYTLYHQEGFSVPYTLTIIDTPGFGDTQGIKRDKEITEQIRSFFTAGASEGIDHVDAVGFVAQSSLARLTPTQTYIFDQILSLFGKDIEGNIFMLLTFADAQSPQVLSCINKAKTLYKNYFKFNNSALYASNKQAAHDDEASDSDDEDSNFDAMFWKMGEKNFKAFLKELNMTESKSLSLTRDVLNERSQLEVSISGIKMDIQLGLNKLEQLKRESEIVREHQADIDKNKDFTYTVKEQQFVTEPIPQGQYITNCLHCQRTCHEICRLADDNAKSNCWAMTKGRCRICPSKCSWNLHKNIPYKYVCKEVEVLKTAEDLKKRYQEANDKVLSAEALVLEMKDEFKAVQINVLGMTEIARNSIERLKEIALKPNPLSTVEYIDILIQAEKSQPLPGWQDRTNQLQDVRKQAEYMQKIAEEGFDPFQEYMNELEKGKTQNEKSWWKNAADYITNKIGDYKLFRSITSDNSKPHSEVAPSSACSSTSPPPKRMRRNENSSPSIL